MNQPLAYVHPGAKIAKNVVIDPFTSINNDVVIGEGTWIGSNVTIMEGARIGKNCTIFPGAVISAPPQDLKYNGEETQTIIGDNTTIRECVTINRGTVDRQKTVIRGNDSMNKKKKLKKKNLPFALHKPSHVRTLRLHAAVTTHPAGEEGRGERKRVVTPYSCRRIKTMKMYHVLFCVCPTCMAST